MNPLDEKGNLGYCEHCGVVYALQKLKGQTEKERAGFLGFGLRGGGGQTGTREESPSTPSRQRGDSSVFRWKCPDCDEDLTADSESDLNFLKTDHIREYHPNRATQGRGWSEGAS